jgi:GNAT superfamily N-acetyltransferase
MDTIKSARVKFCPSTIDKMAIHPLGAALSFKADDPVDAALQGAFLAAISLKFDHRLSSKPILDIDFVNHFALVAVANDAGDRMIVGGGRYVVVQPGQAEVAFAIVDPYQGLGIGSALMRHIAILGREAGLHGSSPRSSRKMSPC